MILYRAVAWAQAYDAYSLLWKEQGAGLEKFPLHMRGEVPAGMAQSAQRTGRAEEAAQFVDRLLMMTGTPYEKTREGVKSQRLSAWIGALSKQALRQAQGRPFDDAQGRPC